MILPPQVRAAGIYVIMGLFAGIVAYVTDGLMRAPFFIGTLFQAILLISTIRLGHRLSGGLAPLHVGRARWVGGFFAMVLVFFVANHIGLSYSGVWGSLPKAEYARYVIALGVLYGVGVVISLRILSGCWHYSALGIVGVSAMDVYARNFSFYPVLDDSTVSKWVFGVIALAGWWLVTLSRTEESA